MPDVLQIGATSSTGVNLLDTTRYRVPADAFKGATEYDFVLTPMMGGHPVLSRHQTNMHTWNGVVRCTRAAGYQERLDDFAAIRTQLQAAIDYALGLTGTPIYLWRQYGNQSAVRQYLIIRGTFDEQEFLGGGANLHLIGHLHLDTRVAGA